MTYLLISKNDGHTQEVDEKRVESVLMVMYHRTQIGELMAALRRGEMVETGFYRIRKADDA